MKKALLGLVVAVMMTDVVLAQDLSWQLYNSVRITGILCVITISFCLIVYFGIKKHEPPEFFKSFAYYFLVYGGLFFVVMSLYLFIDAIFTFSKYTTLK
tara:strand:- start:376 stop:672 length:297 start_codon:yes stop_codon:yes gene_type:complete